MEDDPLKTPNQPLTARERYALELLCCGLDSDRVAADMGISLRTLEKHLASIRRKLSVNRTSQALVIYQRLASRHMPEFHPRQGLPGSPSDLETFAQHLSDCSTFGEAWTCLQLHARPLGAIEINFGLVAEPPGQMTNGGHLIAMTLPGELQAIYDRAGGVTFDPTAHYIASSTTTLQFDLDDFLKKIAAYTPQHLVELTSAFMDYHYRNFICFPMRDSLTGAPYGIVYYVSPETSLHLQSDGGVLRHRLSQISETFWAIIQSKRLLKPMTVLTARQREILLESARGFTVAQCAERLGVSTRAAEKLLAGCRASLGARTTAAAVYRAMVYRAL